MHSSSAIDDSNSKAMGRRWMEEQLRKHVEMLNRLKTSSVPPLEFPPSSRYEMALTSLETYYSFPNIDASNNRLKVSLDDGKTWMDIRMPTGCYEIRAINNELQRFIMTKRGDKEDENRILLSPKPNTLRCVLEILDAKCRVDFNVDGSLCKVLTKVKIWSTY